MVDEPDCVFCKIAKQEIKSELLYNDGEIVAFRDINPQAPTHILIIPVEHIPKISDVKENQKELIGKMLLAANELAKKEKTDEAGYRLVWNCGADAGQEVFHIHLHLLGGRKMTWPPG